MTNIGTTVFNDKIIKLQDIVKNVVRSNHLYKTLGFLEANELHACHTYAESINLKLKQTLVLINTSYAVDNNINENEIINILQGIVIEISTLIHLYGCDTLENLINICIGHNFSVDEKYKERFNLLKAYVKPIRYKILDWHAKLNPADDILCKHSDNFECFNLLNEFFDLNFQYLMYGVKFTIHNIEKQHTLVIYGIIEDIMPDFIENKYVINKINELTSVFEKENIHNAASVCKSYETFIKCLTLKELLLYTIEQIQTIFVCYKEQLIMLNKKSLSQIINDFGEKEMVEKRKMLIILLSNANADANADADANECHYLAYLLYDLLSNDINGMVDTYEQTLIYDSLPYNIKKYFRDTMKQLVYYTNKISNINISKISLEQRICLMKTSDVVKEKAMVKLKEVKMKTEDTGAKAMQFLDGLLKIPFEIYKEEPVLKLMNDNIRMFTSLVKVLTLNHDSYYNKHFVLPFKIKNDYTILEIQNYLPLLKNNYKLDIQLYIFQQIHRIIATCTKKKINEYLGNLKKFIFNEKINVIINCTVKTIIQLRNEFNRCIDECLKLDQNKQIIYVFLETILQPPTPLINVLNTSLSQIEYNSLTVNKFMYNITNILDKAVFGHTSAKRQIERIIGQWVNGDITGYCFGFEGPPGVGKTSLAKKGIAHCLLDENDIARPFAFIAMGGSTNASTLDGHNYTYVGSTWGRIVDILMDTKIMNPIIFIDELDKVSKTENGKEIIGILTHLIDQTQNDSFQDKYFNGINLNLSKALFIFSYNDAELIDQILLDRIHRIKFDAISVDDKLIITQNFILPEIYKKMGLENMIEISSVVIEYIINNYTAEPGVRKLKELMFEIIGEINLHILKNTFHEKNIPIVITIEEIKNNYLNERVEIRPMRIHLNPSIGVINGLWANSLGKGGILPIEASYYPCNTFLDLSLTGMQGDVMKESMNVAKSLAWSLFMKDVNNAQSPQEKLEQHKGQGLHIHVPEGATPKDGPSAGTAITMVMYSLFSCRKIKNDVAITGEICLQGRVSAIGGLELKILGGICAGIKTFIYPQENEKDFVKFMKKYGNKSIIDDIRFITVERIEQVIPLIFV